MTSEMAGDVNSADTVQFRVGVAHGGRRFRPGSRPNRPGQQESVTPWTDQGLEGRGSGAEGCRGFLDLKSLQGRTLPTGILAWTSI